MTVRVRALDKDGDMQFGRSARDFIADVPQVVVQRAVTRLQLQLGDWYRNTTDGTPYRTLVFGMRTNATRDPAIRARILGTPGCTGIAQYASQQNRRTRAWSVRTQIVTRFGQSILSALVPSGSNGDVRYER